MKELIIFDVDNTIVCGQSQAIFIRYLYDKGYVSGLYYVRLISWVLAYKFGIVSNPLSAMKYGLSFIKNRSRKETVEIIDDFFRTVLVHKIYAQAIKIIDDHKENNRDIVLVSNAPDILIERIASHLGVDSFIATKLEIIEGVYTGNIFGEIMYGEEKLLAIKKYIDSTQYSLKNSWAYGDHDSDLFLLSEVAHPFVVNPSKLLKITAIKNNWPILKFNL